MIPALSWVVATAWLVLSVLIVRGRRSILQLSSVSPDRVAWPKVSVIIPARNEERHLEQALTSVLALDYAPLEVIVVNDRSTDQTGAILARVQIDHPALNVLTIETLPPGWLGKNNALASGAAEASGEILLFTDADVVMDPSVLKRGVSLLYKGDLDHLAVVPKVTSSGFLMQGLMGCFTLNFSLYAWPWKARDPKSRMFMGIGAFNLIRTRVYQAIGGHATLAMNPIDDMMIGKRVKQKGFRQELAYGLGLLELEWYATVREFVKGLEKNSFAGARYSVSMVVGGTLLILMLQVWPFVGLLMIPYLSGWLSVLAASLAVLVCADHASAQGYPRSSGLLFPIASLLGIYVIWRSMLLALIRGGIDWRGTRYPLAELRKKIL